MFPIMMVLDPKSIESHNRFKYSGIIFPVIIIIPINVRKSTTILIEVAVSQPSSRIRWDQDRQLQYY